MNWIGLKQYSFVILLVLEAESWKWVSEGWNGWVSWASFSLETLGRIHFLVFSSSHGYCHSFTHGHISAGKACHCNLCLPLLPSFFSCSPAFFSGPWWSPQVHLENSWPLSQLALLTSSDIYTVLLPHKAEEIKRWASLGWGIILLTYLPWIIFLNLSQPMGWYNNGQWERTDQWNDVCLLAPHASLTGSLKLRHDFVYRGYVRSRGQNEKRWVELTELGLAKGRGNKDGIQSVQHATVDFLSTTPFCWFCSALLPVLEIEPRSLYMRDMVLYIGCWAGEIAQHIKALTTQDWQPELEP